MYKHVLTYIHLYACYVLISCLNLYSDTDLCILVVRPVVTNRFVFWSQVFRLHGSIFVAEICINLYSHECIRIIMYKRVLAYEYAMRRTADLAAERGACARDSRRYEEWRSIRCRGGRGEGGSAHRQCTLARADAAKSATRAARAPHTSTAPCMRERGAPSVSGPPAGAAGPHTSTAPSGFAGIARYTFSKGLSVVTFYTVNT